METAELWGIIHQPPLSKPPPPASTSTCCNVSIVSSVLSVSSYTSCTVKQKNVGLAGNASHALIDGLCMQT